MRSRDGQGFADTRRVMLEEAGITPTLFSQRAVGTTTNTTIGAIVTNGRFDKAQLKKIAALGSNGMVRTIRPVNTTADGDSLYAASIGTVSAEISLTGTWQRTPSNKLSAVPFCRLNRCTAFPLPSTESAQGLGEAIFRRIIILLS
mgnify:CR=1 FL=1